MAQALRRVPLDVPGLGSSPVLTAVANKSPSSSPSSSLPPVVLLHGFDSSCLEFRRLWPLLGDKTDTYGLDLVGWGFTDAGYQAGDTSGREVSPETKRAHLYTFWKDVLGGRKMVLCGASLGGAIALDFAVEHPEAVEKLVLVDSQAFIDGIGPMAKIRPLAMAGIDVLRSTQLRMMANKMAYFNKTKFATEDAMRVGRLHTFVEGWKEANFAFMQSGGYAISKKVPKVTVETLIVWGRNDEILEPKFAGKFFDLIPNATLKWVEECGHCAHLEQPEELSRAILRLCHGPIQLDVFTGSRDVDNEQSPQSRNGTTAVGEEMKDWSDSS